MKWESLFRISNSCSTINQVFGIYTEGQGSAYKLWMDGELVLQNGQVGTDLESMVPDKIPTSTFIQPAGEKVEIVIQISNFHHRKGGFRNNLVLDLADPIHEYQPWRQVRLLDINEFPGARSCRVREEDLAGESPTQQS